MPVSSKSKLKTKRKLSVASSAPCSAGRNSNTVSATRSSIPHHPTEGLAPRTMSCRLITRAELSQIVPYTGQHILRLEKSGKFPRRVRVGANRVAWLLSEVEAWGAARVSERDVSFR